MFKLVVFICFYLFLSVFAWAQSKESLEEELENAEQDSTKIRVSLQLAKKWQNEQTSRSIFYAQNAFDLAQKREDRLAVSEATQILGQAHRTEGNYEKAMYFLLQKLHNAEKLKDLPQEVDVLVDIGTLYRIQKNKEKAIENYEKSLELAEKIKYLKGKANGLHNYGNLYYPMKEYDKALNLYKQAYEVRKTIDDKMGMAMSLNNIAKVYEKEAQPQEALKIYLEIQSFLIENDNQEFYAVLLDNIGDVYVRLKEFEKAKKYFDESLRIGEKLNAKIIISDAYESYSNLSLEKSDYQEALLFYKQHFDMNEQIIGEKQANKLNNMQAEYELNKKQLEIDLLNKDRKIDRLVVQGISIFAFILLGFVAVVFRNYQRIRSLNQDLGDRNMEINMQKEELETQAENLKYSNQEIQKQNTNIMASINYAKRIQHAILPLEENIRQSLEDFFVLWKPKNIVSGDFYWFYSFPVGSDQGQVNSKEPNSTLTTDHLPLTTILAAVDCTGHGVPGAFMSMIGSQLLNEIVIERQIWQSNRILEEMNRSIFRILNQQDSNVHDGMDIALCVINKKEQKIQFSGAMNNLYYVQNENFGIIKGDKHSLGGKQLRDKIFFTAHDLKIENEIMIYLCSDGYQDQFGGKEDTKFGVKRFRELLFQISSKPLEVQKQILEETIETWILPSQQELIDDVLVIGVRIKK